MLDEARKALGRNNVAARAEIDGRPVFVKRYFRHPADPRDRLRTEDQMLSFLRSNGIHCVPEPLATDDAAGIAIFEFIEGSPLRAREVGLDDGLQLTDLLARMFELRQSGRAAELPNASDAAFSFIEYLDHLDARLERVRPVGAFVEREAIPVAAMLREWLDARATELGIDLVAETPVRTLSPGDIGFHNAIRRANGELAFVDFEYGGWDDAAHVIASACVPPSVPLPQDLHLPVMRTLLDRFGVAALAPRLRLVYPLLAFKWSLILLNELVGVGRERRRFAGALDEESADSQIKQARAVLHTAVAAAEPTSFLERLIA